MGLQLLLEVVGAVLAAAIGVEQPALGGGDIADVSGPFPVWRVGQNAIQQVLGDAQTVLLSGVTLCLRVRTGRIPLIFISRPTRRKIKRAGWNNALLANLIA